MEDQELKKTAMDRRSSVPQKKTGLNFLPSDYEGSSMKVEDCQVEQQQNLVAELNQQLFMKDEIIEILQKENKLQRGRLKGYETLAYLYQQSKNEGTRLLQVCQQQAGVIEEFRKKASVSQEVQTSPSAPVIRFDNIGCKEIDELESLNSHLHNDEKSSLNLTARISDVREFDQNEAMVHPGSVSTEVESNFCLLEMPASVQSLNEEKNNGDYEELMAAKNPLKLNSVDHEQHWSKELGLFQRHLLNPGASKSSKNFLMELLAVGLKVIDLEKEIDTEENPNRVAPVESSQKQMESLLKPLLSDKELNLTDRVSPCVHHVTEAEKLPKGVCFVTCSSSDEQQRLLCEGNDLLTEVQVLREQVVTFKDDFDRERKDREKAKTRYDFLMRHFDQLSADYSDLKTQLRVMEKKLEVSEKQNTGLKLQISKAAEKLKSFELGSGLKPPPPRLLQSDIFKTWPCVNCTFENPYPRQTCELCGVAGFTHRYLTP